jgi:hypothetical protein
MSLNRQFLIASIDVLCNNGIFTEDKTAFKQKIDKKRSVKFMDLSGSDLYEKNYSNKIFSNAILNPISHCFAQPFR